MFPFLGVPKVMDVLDNWDGELGLLTGHLSWFEVAEGTNSSLCAESPPGLWSILYLVVVYNSIIFGIFKDLCNHPCYLIWIWQFFFPVKCQIVNIGLWAIVYIVVETTNCHCSAKAAIDNM